MRRVLLAAASAAFLFVSSAVLGAPPAAPASPELQRGEEPSTKARECIDANRAMANAKRLNERGAEHVELFADLNSDMSKVFTVKWNASHARFPIRETPEHMMVFVKYREDGRQILLNPVLWVVMFRQGCAFDEGPMSIDEFEKMMDGPSADAAGPRTGEAPADRGQALRGRA